MDIMQEVLEFLEEYADYKMSFSLEYSNIIDWIADFTPRRNHPMAREYDWWRHGQGATPDEAIHSAMEFTRKAIRETINNP